MQLLGSAADIFGFRKSVPIADHVAKCTEQLLVPPAELCFVIHDLQRFLGGNSRAVGPVRGERVVNVC